MDTHCKFQWVLGLDFVTAPTSLNVSQPHFAQCLAVSWAGTLYIFCRGLLPRNGILPGAKFTFRPSLAFSFSYICSVTARQSSIARQPNVVTFSRGRHLYSAGWPSRWASAHILVRFVVDLLYNKQYNKPATNPQQIIHNKSNKLTFGFRSNRSNQCSNMLNIAEQTTI